MIITNQMPCDLKTLQTLVNDRQLQFPGSSPTQTQKDLLQTAEYIRKQIFHNEETRRPHQDFGINRDITPFDIAYTLSAQLPIKKPLFSFFAPPISYTDLRAGILAALKCTEEDMEFFKRLRKIEYSYPEPPSSSPKRKYIEDKQGLFCQETYIVYMQNKTNFRSWIEDLTLKGTTLVTSEEWEAFKSKDFPGKDKKAIPGLNWIRSCLMHVNKTEKPPMFSDINAMMQTLGRLKPEQITKLAKALKYLYENDALDENSFNDIKDYSDPQALASLIVILKKASPKTETLCTEINISAIKKYKGDISKLTKAIIFLRDNKILKPKTLIPLIYELAYPAESEYVSETIYFVKEPEALAIIFVCLESIHHLEKWVRNSIDLLIVHPNLTKLAIGATVLQQAGILLEIFTYIIGTTQAYYSAPDELAEAYAQMHKAKILFNKDDSRDLQNNRNILIKGTEQEIKIRNSAIKMLSEDNILSSKTFDCIKDHTYPDKVAEALCKLHKCGLLFEETWFGFGPIVWFDDYISFVIENSAGDLVYDLNRLNPKSSKADNLKEFKNIQAGITVVSQDDPPYYLPQAPQPSLYVSSAINVYEKARTSYSSENSASSPTSCFTFLSPPPSVGYPSMPRPSAPPMQPSLRPPS